MKKIFSSLVIAVFAVTLMAGLPAAVSAGQWNNYTAADSADADTYAVQNKDKTQIPTAALCYGLTLGVDLTADDTIEATVGNAKFDEKSWGGLDASVGDLGPIDAGAISPLNATDTTVKYRITTDGADLTGIAAGADKGNFMLFDANGPALDPAVFGDNAIFDLTGLTADSYVSLQMDVKTQIGDAVDSTPVVYNIIKGINEADVTTETASATVTIDVALEKKEVLGGGVATAVARYEVTDNAADIDNQNCDAEKILYTISGNMSAVDTIESAVGVTSCDAEGTLGTGPGAGDFWVDTANNKAYAVNTAVLNNVALNMNDLVVTFDVDTIIPESAYTIQATYLGDDDVAAWTLDTTLFTFLDLKYNGVVAYAGMVAGSGNAGWGGGFRIVNRTNMDANIYFQAQAVNGGVMSDQVVYGTQVSANKSIYVSADTVYDTCGLPNTTTGNVIITVEAEDVDIFQTSTTPNGHTIIPLTVSNNQ